MRHGAPGEHQRPVRVAGRLPPLVDGGRRRDGPEVAIQDGRQAVADVGRRQARPGLLGGDADQALDAAGQRVGVVRAHGQPRRGVMGQEPAEPDVGARPEPGVGARLDQLDAGRELGAQAGDRGRGGAVVDDDDARDEALVEEVRDRAEHRPGRLAVHDHEVDGGEGHGRDPDGPGPTAPTGAAGSNEASRGDRFHRSEVEAMGSGPGTLASGSGSRNRLPRLPGPGRVTGAGRLAGP